MSYMPQVAAVNRETTPYDNRSSGYQINKPSACFTVLSCDELFRNILHYLTWLRVDDLPDEAGVGRTLVSLATVCRAVSRLALATLWAKLDSIDPIISLWGSTNDPSHSTAVASALRTRMSEYMGYVRDIEVDSGTIPPALLTEHAAPLLPSLRRLCWVVPFEGTIQPFWSLVSPSLTTLHVDVALNCSSRLDAKILETILDGLNTVARICPSLATVEISSIYGSLLPAAASVLDALSSLSELTSISASTNVIASPEMLPKLSKLPSLRSLQIRSFDHTNLDGVDLVATSAGFDSLGTLSLEGPSSFVHDVLDGMPHCGVRKCTIALQGYTQVRIQDIITENLARKFGPSLDTLSLSVPGDSYALDYERIIPLSVSIFRSLRTINLVDVRLEWVEAYKISDALCEDMATSWPRLRVLHMAPFEFREHLPPSGTTLRGLRHFAERCAALEEMALQIDATGDHWAKEAGSVSASQTRARPVSLDLFASRVTSPEAVAAYLKACFPRISALWYSWVTTRMYRCEDQIAAWDRLYDLLVSDSEE